MLQERADLQRTARFLPSGPDGPYPGLAGGAGLLEETAWGEAGAAFDDVPDDRIFASRWVDTRCDTRRERTSFPKDRYVIGVALRATKMRLVQAGHTLIDGSIPAGTMHLHAPAQALEAEFYRPCDFVHFRVPVDYIEERRRALGIAPTIELDGSRAHDLLAAQLARTLIEGPHGADRLYQESIGQAIVTRVLMSRASTNGSSSGLPKWRLRRVQQFVNSHISERITLGDMASAAGLSAMHFAAKFRAATGCRPHEYLLQQRIERAKAAICDENLSLVEAALSVGFQTQAHFTTVFKRITGETPGEWRRANRAQPPATVNAGRLRPS